MTCNICNNILNIPQKSICHVYCFLCLKYTQLETQQIDKCPICITLPNNQNLNSINNFNFDNPHTNHMWLYSSNYNGTWWTYNSESNNKIEKIHKDYLLRQEIANDQNNKNTSIKFTMPKIKKKVINRATPIIFDNIDIDDEIDTDDCIDFTGIENISKKEENVVHQNNEPLSYIIKCGNYEYKIDFNSMKQINTIDTWRQRLIKRIEIPLNIMSTNTQSIIEYLISLGVIGISGKKF